MPVLVRPTLTRVREDHGTAYYLAVSSAAAIVPSTTGGTCFALLGDDHTSQRNIWLGFIILCCAVALTTMSKVVSETATAAHGLKVRALISLASAAILVGGAAWATTAILLIDRFVQTGWWLIPLALGAITLSAVSVVAVLFCRVHLSPTTPTD